MSTVSKNYGEAYMYSAWKGVSLDSSSKKCCATIGQLLASCFRLLIGHAPEIHFSVLIKFLCLVVCL